jgi:hypothetical protein
MESNTKAENPGVNPPRYIDHDEFTGGNDAGTTEFLSTCDLVIGIDFGTTFSGVAYAHTAGLSQNDGKANLNVALERIHVVRTWPNQTRYHSEKTPSVIAYQTAPGPPIWGGSVRPKDEPQVRCFKLGLQENVREHYKIQGDQESIPNSILGGFLSEDKWRHPQLPDKTALDFTMDYLKSIHNYVLNEVLPQRYGQEFLKNQKFSYVLTVPAIWSDLAKDLTRRAAIAAGIPRKKLSLITEPEAAALYCATQSKQSDLYKGDRFMICDAGGGTVVYPLTNRPEVLRTLSVMKLQQKSHFLWMNVLSALALLVVPFILTNASKASSKHY